jgi:hypothetical protein
MSVDYTISSRHMALGARSAVTDLDKAVVCATESPASVTSKQHPPALIVVDKAAEDVENGRVVR